MVLAWRYSNYAWVLLPRWSGNPFRLAPTRSQIPRDFRYISAGRIPWMQTRLSAFAEAQANVFWSRPGKARMVWDYISGVTLIWIEVIESSAREPKQIEERHRLICYSEQAIRVTSVSVLWKIVVIVGVGL